MVDLGDSWRIDYQVQHGAILTRRQDELTMGMFMNVIREVMGPHYSPRAIHFEHTRPEFWQEHSKLFNAPVYFDQPLTPSSFQKRRPTYYAWPRFYFINSNFRYAAVTQSLFSKSKSCRSGALSHPT